MRPRLVRVGLSKVPGSSTGWPSSSVLGRMRHPSEMTGDELGSACVAAAREQVDSRQFWNLVCERATSLGSSMEPRELSLLLNGLSRTRQLGHQGQMVDSLEGVIIRKLPYFSSVQLAMTLSALAKTTFSQPVSLSTLFPALLKEIKARPHELGTAVEFTMVLNALGKLGVASTDPAFCQRLGSVMVSKLVNGTVYFSARELCVIANGFSILGVREIALYDAICSRVVSWAEEISPLELARLMLALSRVGMNIESLTQTAVSVTGPKFKYLSSSDLVSVVYTFGNVCEYVPCDNLAALFDIVNDAILSSFSLLQLSELSSMLTSLSRWRVPVGRTASQLLRKLKTVKFSTDDLHAVQIVGSLYRILRNEEKSLSKDFILMTIDVMGKSIARTAARPEDWNSILRALVACNELKLTDQPLISALTQCLVNNRNTLERHIALSLADSLANNHIVSPAADLVLALRTSS